MVRIANPLVQTLPTVVLERAPTRAAARSTTAAAAIIAVAFILTSAAVSLYLAQVSSVATAGYQLEQLETQRKEWIARNGQLELELAKRRSLVWSEAEAIQRLGMTRADRPVFIPAEPLVAGDCATPTTSCEGAAAAKTVPPTQPQSQARPTPGNPIQALDGLRSWLISMRGTDE